MLLALVVVWLPGWMRPSVSRARIRTALVTTGPVEAVIMASGTVVPEVERVLSSPLDARVLRMLQRPGAHLKRGDPVVELDVSESVLALEKVVKDLKIKDNQQAQTRLTLEKSLVDLDGTLEVKALELAVGAGAARRRSSSSSRRGCSRARRCAASELAREAGATSSWRSCATSARTPSGPPPCSSRGSRSSAARSTRKPRRRGGCSISRPPNRIATAC